ncbi:hypothetical protein QQ045_031062 [Rhodiola kirilowii]
MFTAKMMRLKLKNTFILFFAALIFMAHVSQQRPLLLSTDLASGLNAGGGDLPYDPGYPFLDGGDDYLPDAPSPSDTDDGYEPADDDYDYVLDAPSPADYLIWNSI